MKFWTRLLLLYVVVTAIVVPQLAATTVFLQRGVYAIQAGSDASLATVRRQDREARNAKGIVTRLPVEEHLRRAGIYHVNRAFVEAREHWQALINYYPDNPLVAESLLGIGRSYFQERRYSDAYDAYNRLARNYAATKEGREGLNFSAASLLRLGRTFGSASEAGFL